MRALPVVDLPVEHTPGCAVVRFPDEVDLLNAPAVREQLLRLLNTGVPALVLDLTATDFIDSAAVHAIIRARVRCQALAVPLAVAIPERGAVRRVFDVMALSRLVVTRYDVPAARAALTVPPQGAGEEVVPS